MNGPSFDEHDLARLDSLARLDATFGAPKQERAFHLIPFENIKFDATPTYLVKGLVPRVGLTVIWGPPKCGKSFLTFDLMMHIALGWEYRGRRVRQGAVVYCALEGAEGFRARVEAFRQTHLAESTEPVAFSLIASPMGLVADHPALIAAIRHALGHVPPAAVVIDTLNRSLAGSENDDRDMAAYVQAADVIRNAFTCAVIIVHHCGHDATRPRGHSSLMGAVDAQLSVKRDAADNIIATVELMKDGEQGHEIVSRLETIEVGIDSDGDPISSCIIVPVDGGSRAKKAPGPKLTKGARIALSALHEAIAERAVIPPASNHIPPNVKAVTVSQWREYAYRKGIASSDEPRARQVAFQRAHETLLAAKLVGVWEPHAWIV
ncbi:helicase RepA family protein [Methylocapsa palsarum]|uniref:AAA domain-containing protein n=1 Tax=Methylocapsa palsarum TaxID=1612308 RepID=A0A1I4CQ47_9HYPH|nr:helicase RepA family protein [Methylocapsa palsarum]SFK83414.1 AAA domain-containing protein [Methylocapsa palsarum]